MIPSNDKAGCGFAADRGAAFFSARNPVYNSVASGLEMEMLVIRPSKAASQNRVLVCVALLAARGNYAHAQKTTKKDAVQEAGRAREGGGC